jgi:hypothetical protein
MPPDVVACIRSPQNRSEMRHVAHFAKIARSRTDFPPWVLSRRALKFPRCLQRDRLGEDLGTKRLGFNGDAIGIRRDF